MLVGSWTIRSYDSGPFVLVFERGDVQVEAVERATWSGHFMQFQCRYSTSLELMTYSSGRIEGSGGDAVGAFEICDRFLDNAATGHFLFTKKYAHHAISYEGVRQGSIMEGAYQSPDMGRDSFRLEKLTN